NQANASNQHAATIRNGVQCRWLCCFEAQFSVENGVHGLKLKQLNLAPFDPVQDARLDLDKGSVVGVSRAVLSGDSERRQWGSIADLAKHCILQNRRDILSSVCKAQNFDALPGHERRHLRGLNIKALSLIGYKKRFTGTLQSDDALEFDAVPVLFVRVILKQVAYFACLARKWISGSRCSNRNSIEIRYLDRDLDELTLSVEVGNANSANGDLRIHQPCAFFRVRIFDWHHHA